jgi:proton-dependent oligopeptide transporter, POT family
MNADEHKEKHPPGLYVLFFTEMWERFGFYSMLAMFVLYLRDSERGLGWSAEQAAGLYANYLMFVYASPLIGGWIADKGLGFRNSVLIGGLVFMVGYYTLSIKEEWAVYLALCLLVIGNGFFKPNVSAMVGHLYPERSALKDRAYLIFYMGINIGALLAPISAEVLVNGLEWPIHITAIGFNRAFLVASAGMVLSVLILWTFKRYIEPPTAQAEAATAAAAADRPANQIESVSDATRVGALIVVFLIVIVFWMVFHQNGLTLTYWGDDNTEWNVSGIISNAINPFWVVTLTFPVVWLWGWLNKRGLEPATPTKMAFGMFLTTASFTILYFGAKAGEAIEVRPDMYATGSFKINDRVLANLQAEGVPDSVLEKLDRYEEHEVTMLWLFKYKTKKYLVKGKKFSPDQSQTGDEKLAEGLRTVLSGEEVNKYKAQVARHSFLFRVSALWLIIAYAVITVGELMLSPMGLSLVSKVAPARLRGLMMGGWFVATAIGNKLTMIGVYYDIWLQSTFFAVMGGLALVMGIVLVILLVPLKKAMPGV